MSKKCTPLWRKAQVQVKMYKAPQHFWKLRCRKSARRCGAKHISKSKSEQNVRFCSMSKNDGRRGTFEEDLQRRISRGRRRTRDMFIRDVRRSGRWFPERGCILEHQICRFAKVILRDRCSSSYDLASIFRGRRGTLDRWSGKFSQWYEAVSSALNFPFLKEVSQNCFVFDVVKFKNWGSLADLFRFGCCQVQKLRKCRKIAAFSSLQIDRQIDR